MNNFLRLATASLIIFAGAIGVTLACSCIDAGPFLIAARDAPLIVRGRVTYHLQHGLALEIHEVYRGDESRSLVRVWGDNGRLCREYADQFPDGSEWVFALHRIDDDFRLDGEAPGDFEIASCGEYAVRVVDGNVITFDEYGRERHVSLSELSDRLRPWGNLD